MLVKTATGKEEDSVGKNAGGAMASRRCGRAGRLPTPYRGRCHKGGRHGREGVGDLLLWGGAEHHGEEEEPSSLLAVVWEKGTAKMCASAEVEEREKGCGG